MNVEHPSHPEDDILKGFPQYDDSPVLDEVLAIWNELQSQALPLFNENEMTFDEILEKRLELDQIIQQLFEERIDRLVANPDSKVALYDKSAWNEGADKYMSIVGVEQDSITIEPLIKYQEVIRLLTLSLNVTKTEDV